MQYHFNQLNINQRVLQEVSKSESDKLIFVINISVNLNFKIDSNHQKLTNTIKTTANF